MPPHSVYLWTLPMFHCNGWCFPWTMAANAGTNVCLRRVDAKLIFDAIREAQGDTLLRRARSSTRCSSTRRPSGGEGIDHKVSALIAAAPPPAAVIEGMERIGFDSPTSTA